jgi:poly(A) polymerase
MPIITPAYPAMCATHNVTASTQMVMTEEFKKGADIVDKVIVGTAQWSELFSKHEFFHKYRYYLQVIASTGSAALQIKWCAPSCPDNSLCYIVRPQVGNRRVSNKAIGHET